MAAVTIFCSVWVYGLPPFSLSISPCFIKVTPCFLLCCLTHWCNYIQNDFFFQPVFNLKIIILVLDAFGTEGGLFLTAHLSFPNASFIQPSNTTSLYKYQYCAVLKLQISSQPSAGLCTYYHYLPVIVLAFFVDDEGFPAVCILDRSPKSVS